MLKSMIEWRANKTITPIYGCNIQIQPMVICNIRLAARTWFTASHIQKSCALRHYRFERMGNWIPSLDHDGVWCVWGRIGQDRLGSGSGLESWGRGDVEIELSHSSHILLSLRSNLVLQFIVIGCEEKSRWTFNRIIESSRLDFTTSLNFYRLSQFLFISFDWIFRFLFYSIIIICIIIYLFIFIYFIIFRIFILFDNNYFHYYFIILIRYYLFYYYYLLSYY